MADHQTYEELNANQLMANNNNNSVNGINNGNNKQVAMMMKTPSTDTNGSAAGGGGSKDGTIIEVSWRNLVYTVPKSRLASLMRKDNRNRTILKGLSGYFRSGNLTAIMGPSGAGKSTLLECVSGFRKNGLSGDVKITGSSSIKIGLIAQNDHLLNQLTVKEALIFASKLKNYNHLDNSSKELAEVIVDDSYAESQVVIAGTDSSSYHDMLARHVIKQLGLEVCADTRSANCSGGQRKRLSIALELISKPNILILDEPTSGLDSSACYQTVSVMQDLTQQMQSKNPIAVVATIHQPSARVFNLFHHVYVISFDGQCIYQGSPTELISQLSAVGLNCPQFHNPADFIAEVASGEYGHEGIVKLADNKKQADSLQPPISGPKTLTLAQISQTQSYPILLHTWLLFYRSLLVILRDPMLTSLRFISHLVTAVFIGLLYGDAIGAPGGCPPQVSPLNDLEHFAEFRETYEKETITITENVAFIFFTLMFIMFGAMMPTIMTFPLDMQVFRKERTNGWYSCGTYYLAKTLADMPFQFVFPATFTAVSYYMTGQDGSVLRFGGFTAISIAIALIAQSQGLLIGALFMEDASAAVFLGPITCIPLMLFAGFFVRISTIPIYFRPLTYISYLRYSFEAYIAVLYGYNRCQWDPSLANLTNAKPEWLEYLSQILAPDTNLDSDGESSGGGGGGGGGGDDNFIQTLLDNLSGQFSSSTEDDYKSIVMSQFEVTDDSLIWNTIILILFFVIMRILTYGVLLWKVNKRE
ncbi:ATP-binding cassette sub-family G member 4-like [Oppia nitens]|uniref:ATP-binding cassette sub-family G member 4-like n=1 Tax=Oppia nitens TaxID=1686743 RepID=UPI0023DA82B6|nr:ATP-binding cassette sub-family G member 4-like [Oppia nitens]